MSAISPLTLCKIVSLLSSRYLVKPNSIIQTEYFFSIKVTKFQRIYAFTLVEKEIEKQIAQLEYLSKSLSKSVHFSRSLLKKWLGLQVLKPENETSELIRNLLPAGIIFIWFENLQNLEGCCTNLMDINRSSVNRTLTCTLGDILPILLIL